MPYSMTGFGAASAQALGFVARVEVRSVNHRFLDVVIRLPRGYGALQDRMQAAIAARLRRGRVEVECTLTAQPGPSDAPSDPSAVVVDWARLDAYLQALRAAAARVEALGMRWTAR